MTLWIGLSRTTAAELLVTDASGELTADDAAAEAQAAQFFLDLALVEIERRCLLG